MKVQELNLDKVMARIEKRLNPTINENYQHRPNVRMKRNTAVITREEFDCLADKIQELIYFQESTLLQQDLLEMVSGLEVKEIE